MFVNNCIETNCIVNSIIPNEVEEEQEWKENRRNLLLVYSNPQILNRELDKYPVIISYSNDSF